LLEHLALADGIAAAFARRYGDLVERDDLIQEARLELVRAAARCRGNQPQPYLRRCIQGALQHHLRDRALLVRLPARQRGAVPWRHLSLDAPLSGELKGQLKQLLTAKPQDSLHDDEQYTGQLPELEELLAALPPDQAAAVRLTLLEGLSLRAAAAQLGVSRSTVHRAQQRGVEGLRAGARKQRQPAALVPVAPPLPRKADQP
jgi:RNA polymerase sigma factor (sigma-70 family)